MTIRLPLPVYMAADDAGAGIDTADKATVNDTIVATDTGVDKTADTDKPATRALETNALESTVTDKPVAAPADFPDDWRLKMAGGDKKEAARLERFKTPADVWKSYAAAEAKITSGKAGAVEPPPDGEKDPDGLKAWREANGVPADPTGYALPAEVTKRMYDEDKPVLASFTEFAHQKNLPPSAVAAAAEWYVEQQDAAYALRNEQDKKESVETTDALYAAYGSEAQGNKTMAERLAKHILPDVDWFKARLPNDPKYGANAGRMLSNIPDFVKALVDGGNQYWGDVAFAGGEASAKTATERETIETLMNNDFAKYDGDPAMKKRYAEILAAEEKRRK